MKKILILAGGYSKEKEISLKTAKSVFSELNKTLQISILCFVGLSPDFLSFFIYSILEVIVFYNYSK